jgi:cysteine-rich repeat protein
MHTYRLIASLWVVLQLSCGLVGRIEELGSLCTDGEDNDGDGTTDCEEITCFFNDACRCGNGLPQPEEECDFGPLNSDTDPDLCRTDCTLPHCGDAVQDSFEFCDDGNTQSNDGCSESCEEEYCGDGVVNGQVEQCDDGNLKSGDACDELCQLE